MFVEENYLEDILKKYFQKKVSLIIDGEEIKSGTFLLYVLTIYSNNYFIEFHIKTDKKIEILKVPYPFLSEEHENENLVFFDYRLSTLCRNKKKVVEKLMNCIEGISTHKDNKFFNKILELKFE
jgi:hypothetical protein